MADKTRTVILNGTKVWLSVMFFVLVQTGSAVWWASSIHTSVGEIRNDVTEIKSDIKAVEKSIYEAHTANDTRG